MKTRSIFAAAWLALAFATAVVGTLGVSSCATIGIHAPESFNERVAAGYATVQAIADSTSLLLDSGDITADDARNIHTQATTAKEGIDIAVQIHQSGEITTAEGRLQAIITGLAAVQTYLRSKK